MKCPNCGAEWNTNTRCCPTCGQTWENQTDKKEQKDYLKASVIVSISAGILAIIANPLSNNGETNFLFGILTTIIPVLWIWYGFGYCVQSLAWKKGYHIKFGWGYWFNIFALLYWGFVPVEPTYQVSLIKTAIRQVYYDNRPMQEAVSMFVQTVTEDAQLQEAVPMPAQTVTEDTQLCQRYCIECGAAIRSGGIFCSKCGTPVKEGEDKI